MASNDNMIAALLRERATYERQGKPDRVRQVDKQLEHYGYSPEDEDDGPQGRTAPPQQTTDRGQQPSGQEPEGKAPARKTAAKKTAATPPAE